MAPTHDDWPFDDPPNVACLSMRSIVDGSKPILRVSHDEDDGAWQMLPGGAPDMGEAMLVALRSLVARDPSLRELADLPPGWSASRERPGAPWVRRCDAGPAAGPR